MLGHRLSCFIVNSVAKDFHQKSRQYWYLKLVMFPLNYKKIKRKSGDLTLHVVFLTLDRPEYSAIICEEAT